MSVPIVINGVTFELPTQGENPPWGMDLSDVIIALANVAEANTGTGDILPSTFAILNNVTSPTLITGLAFDQSKVRSAQVTYSVERSNNSTEVVENGTVYITYNSTTNTWTQSQACTGDAGITFSITNGQFYYVTTDMGGTSNSGNLGFFARAFGQ